MSRTADFEGLRAGQVDHDHEDHDWESCSKCVKQAIEDEMLAPGSKPFPSQENEEPTDAL